MCHACIAIIKDKKTVSYNQYELAKSLGIPVKKLPACEGYPETAIVGNSCLCPVDIKKLGQTLNLHVTAPYELEGAHNDEWIITDKPHKTN